MEIAPPTGRWTAEHVANFAIALADAYADQMKRHGYRSPPYEADGICCSLPMMYRAFAKLGLITLKNDDPFEWDINEEFWNDGK